MEGKFKEEKDLFSQKSIKQALNIANITMIVIFSVLLFMLIIHNTLILISRGNIDKSARIADYGKIGNTYFVQVTSDAWAKYFDRFTLLLVEEVYYDNEYLSDPQNQNALTKVYLARITSEDEEEVKYTVGKITSKVDEGVVLNYDRYVEYKDLVGVVQADIPVIAIFNNEWFLFIALFIIIAYFSMLIVFSTSTLGYDVMFENQVGRELKKDRLFGLNIRMNRRRKQYKNSAEEVELLVSDIICDSVKESQEISTKDLINAYKVIDAHDFSTKEKIFVYFAALNMLNSYVKKDDILPCMKGEYYFKKYVSFGVNYLASHPNNAVDIYASQDLLIVECMGMEFSFHNVKTEFEFIEKSWGGIKLQPYAKSIFDLFYQREFANYNFVLKDQTIIDLLEKIAQEAQ